MARSGQQSDSAKPATTDLESYRRLIELQKELVGLSEQYKLSKRQRDELFDVVAREVAERLQRKSLRQRLQYAAARWLERSKPQDGAMMFRWREMLRRL